MFCFKQIRVPPLLLILIVAIVYFIAARMSLKLAFLQSNATPVWPPSGIAFAAALLLGLRIWPGVMLGAFAANVYVFLENNASPLPTTLLVSSVISAGNTLEMVVGYYLLRNTLDASDFFSRAMEVLKFSVIAASMCLVSSAMGPLAVSLAGIVDWRDTLTVWFTWWTGDVAGVLVITPLLMSWAKSLGFRYDIGKALEFVLAFLLLYAVSEFVFQAGDNARLSSVHYYLVIPFLLWITLRFDLRETTLAIALSSGVAVLETTQGKGPFFAGPLNESLLALQGYIAIISITFLTLSCALDERRRARSELQKAHDDLEEAVRERTGELEKSRTELDTFRDRIDDILKVLLQYAHGDFTRKVAISPKGDELDAIAAGLNALSEELESNIGEIKRREASLKRAKTQLTAAQQLARIGSWEWDLISNTVDWSEELYRIHGLDPADKPITTETIFNQTHPADIESVRNQINESRETLKPFNFYYRIILPNGSIRSLHARGEVITDETGTATRLVGTAQDVTERLNEDELEKLAVAATKSYNSVMIADRSGKIVWVNEGFEKLTGYSLEEVRNTHGEVLRKGSKTGLSQETNYYETVIREKKPVTYDGKNFAKNGQEYWVITTLTPVIDQNGEVERIIAIDSDITSRKQMEDDLINANKIAEHSLMKGNRALDELIKAKKALEESMKVKEQFLANMSHEIRTPMNAIVGFTELILKTEITPEQRQYIDAIKISGENLLVIINDILDFSKLQSGKVSFEQIQFRLSQVISTLTDLMLPKSIEKSIQFSTEIDKRIPDHLIGDPTRLNQILLNLVGNAIKFTEEGEVKVLAHLESEDAECVNLEFKVVDTGIGIPPDKIDTIFDEFTQATSETTRKYGGSGLGLAIVKQLVELQGGKLFAESAVGAGSVFGFSLKLKKSFSSGTIGENLEEPSETAVKIEGINILLVEDNVLNQILAQKVLADWKWNVELAENGLIAIEKLKKMDFDLILMDIQLPEMDGYEATRYIRNKLDAPKCRTPIMAMTAHAMSTEEEKCHKAGMDGYISKPFNPKVLYQRAVALLNGQPGQIEKAELKKMINPRKQRNMRHTDLSYLRQLSNGSDKFVKEMIQLFLQQTPISLDHLNQHLKTGNWQLLRAAAHKMKPSISFMGLKEIEQTLKELEESAANESALEQLPAMVEKVTQISKEGMDELRADLETFK